MNCLFHPLLAYVAWPYKAEVRGLCSFILVGNLAAKNLLH